MNTSQRERSLLATLIDIQVISQNEAIPDGDARQRMGSLADAAIKNIVKIPDGRAVALVAATHRVVPYCPTKKQLQAVLGESFDEGEDVMLTADYKKMLDAAPAAPVVDE